VFNAHSVSYTPDPKLKDISKGCFHKCKRLVCNQQPNRSSIIERLRKLTAMTSAKISSLNHRKRKKKKKKISEEVPTSQNNKEEVHTYSKNTSISTGQEFARAFLFLSAFPENMNKT